MKTRLKDNKYYIEGKIVMLPTNDLNSNILLSHETRPHKLYYGKRVYGDVEYNQHLYLVCDLPIEEGEWFISEIGELWQHNGEIQPSKWSRKVIATTDYNLHQDNRKPLGIWINLPQFSKPFIKEFVERQSKDVDVLVEVDYILGNKEDENYNLIPEIVIKLNPDNTVNLIFK